MADKEEGLTRIFSTLAFFLLLILAPTFGSYIADGREILRGLLSTQSFVKMTLLIMNNLTTLVLYGK